ncbi:shikimate kinase AroK [Porticoccaceae bacterium LTM1]|nr:shikimate kinase AroK [Porticoccaceae bacterium LTM1]
MKYSKNIYLIGPMGTGKTTIGKKLAEYLDLPFLDLDHEIEDRSGAEVAWIFEKEGEVGFRQRETAMLDEITQKQGVVLATGGGAVLAPENRQMLKGRGLVVYLSSTLEQLVERTRRDKKRPLLQVDNPGEVLRAMLMARDPLYREVADIIVSARSNRPEKAAKDLAEQLEPYLA